MQQTQLKKKRGISPIWILPIVAILVGGWLLYKGLQDAGIDIVINFKSGEGVTIGKTQVIYKGIPIGIVRGKDVSPDMKSIALKVEMNKRTEASLVEDAKFWIVKPEVSAGRISGLGTLLSGSYIAVQKGVSKTPSRVFTGLEEAPGLPDNAPGLHFKLQADRLGSIQRGTQIYFKNIVVGEVQSHKLVGDKGVEIEAFIKPKYSNLVQYSTRFWNSSGVTINGGLSGFKVRVESAASLIYGGISLYTPEQLKDSPQAVNGEVFKLYPDYDAAEYGIKMTLKLPAAMGLTKGSSKVMYRGFGLGVVTDFTFNKEDPTKNVTAQILLEPDAKWILKEGTKFWVVEPQFSVNRVQNLDTLIKGTHISFKPGKGKYRNSFEIIAQPEEEEILRPGVTFQLMADNSSSLSTGAPVIFRGMTVGEIIHYDLSADGERIKAKFFIEKKYAGLVRKNSVFWKTGGIKIDASLDGLYIETGTVTSIIAGGVSFENPGSKNSNKSSAKADTSFTLYESIRNATKDVPALQPKGLYVKLRAESSKSFAIDSPVLYKHIEVGKIADVSLAKNSKDIMLDVFIEDEYRHLLQTTSRFYNVSGITVEGGLSGLEVKTDSLKSILKGGITFFTPVDGKPADKNSAFTLYDDYQSAVEIDKTKIVIHFSSPQGLKDGVDIKYQGVTIGNVAKVKFDHDMENVTVDAIIDEGMEKLFRVDSRVWLVTADVSLSGIKNIDTLIKGAYIAVLPGEGSPVLELNAQNEAPSMMDEIRGGLTIIVEASALGSLKPNAPVYYRQFRVGSVMGSALSATAQKIQIFVNIDQQYVDLIHENTVFWNSSGINVDAGLFSGVQINTESFEAIIAGGISLATPEDDAMGEPVVSGHNFVLQDKMQDVWLTWNPNISMDNTQP